LHQQVKDEKTELETRLDSAFQETLSKTQLAITETENQDPSFVKKIWLATEAAEYTSLLYSLTYDLQDCDPEVGKRRGEDPIVLLKDSLRILKLAIGKRSQGAVKNGYENLRTAAEFLKTVYLEQTKTSATRRSKPASSLRIAYKSRSGKSKA
jgi:hypothetical protein